jgi:hypothetical protein
MAYRNQLFLVLAGLTALLSVTLFLRIYVWDSTQSDQMDKKNKKEGFLTIPRVGVDPMTPHPKPPVTETETPEGVQADANWRAILEYVQKNPDKAAPFLADMKTKFFNSSCGIKQPRIDFEHLAESYQPIFTA